MSFGSFINIGKLGITGAIKQKLLEEHISVKNFDISAWQEIMDAIKDDENFKNVYSGSTNLRDKNAFLVAKATTVQISESLWNKILNVVRKHNGTSVEHEEPTFEQNCTKANGKLDLRNTYPNLPFSENGDIDFDSFTLDKLKKQFPEKDFFVDVESNDNGQFIRVRSKTNNDIVFSYSNMNTPNGDKMKCVAFEDKGKPTQLTYTNGKFSSRTTFNIDGDKCLLDTQESYDENQNLIRREIWNKDNTSFTAQDYSNGILCSEIKFVKDDNDIFNIAEEKKILSDKLVQDITKRIRACQDGIGFLPKTDDIEKNISQGISKNNILSVLSDYKQATGNSLIQDLIDDKMGLGYEQQKELIKHLTTLTRESYSAQHDKEHYWEGLSLGYELQFALRHNEKDMLKNILGNVNKDSIEVVLEKMYKVEGSDSFTDYSDKLYMQLSRMLGDDAEKYISNLQSIMIQHINEKGGYTKDLVEDIKANQGENPEAAIDFTRLLNRCKAGQTSTITGKSDGKIDINNIQQKGTGDCWLISAVLSAANKNQKGLEFINSMLSVDANGNVTVELKGVNKKYVILAEEIEKSNHLASGDPDMRAIEIAVDKYMKELAYDVNNSGTQDFSRADINGDFENFAYQVLFGNGYTDEQPDILNEDYNSENQVYSLSFGGNPNVKATVLGNSSTEKQEVDLLGRHAYAVKNSDDNYIYLINPHNSAETLQVERSLLQSKKPRIFFAQIDKNALLE